MLYRARLYGRVARQAGICISRIEVSRIEGGASIDAHRAATDIAARRKRALGVETRPWRNVRYPAAAAKMCAAKMCAPAAAGEAAEMSSAMSATADMRGSAAPAATAASTVPTAATVPGVSGAR